ncbi:MAG: ABC transporter ATP-binding protein [Thermoproteota archaeon]|nr:MAG: ABC transporter ATP-binding protein [Candidatus Korarchaeota archaeon]
MVEVRLRGVSKRFGTTLALKEVDLTVPDGSITVVVGPSGCGKTTMLRIIAGLEIPDSGKVLFDGRDVTGLPPRDRNVGMVFQDLALFPHLTVLDNVAFGLIARGYEEDEAKRVAISLIRLLKLEGLERRYPHQLSGGQRQRVALARALAPNPSVLLLDEPFGALDARLRERLLWEVRRLHSERKFTAIHVTHDQAEALAIADRLAIMKDGRIIREGPSEEVVRDPRSEFAARFLGANVLRLEKVDNSKYRIGNQVLNLQSEEEEVLLAFYPEEVEPSDEGLEGEVKAISFSRLGYRLIVDVEGVEVELLWKGRPSQKVRFRPTNPMLI